MQQQTPERSSGAVGPRRQEEQRALGGRRRVVVTGLGAITPLGNDVQSFWEGLIAGRSGIGAMTLCDTTGYPCAVAGETKDFEARKYMDAKEARRMARFSQFAVAAARQAVDDARLDLATEDPTRLGVLLGNGNGGFPEIEQAVRVLVAKGGMRLNPLFFPTILPNMAAAQISLTFGIKGYSATIATACAAANQALGEALEVVRRGAADIMLAGGAEAGISQLGLGGFCVIRAMSTRSNDAPEKASRPFDALRDGFVPAEGAAILVLESLDHARARGATILCELAGYGASADAYHLVAPDAEGHGPALAMQRAVADASLEPDDVDYINAHGTSTPQGDVAETIAVKRVFGARAYRIPISSTKSMIGHSLGAAGALEAVACVQTIRQGVVHPTVNYEVPDPACDLDYVPNVARRVGADVVLSNGFGFGGQNACLVFKRWGGGGS